MPKDVPRFVYIDGQDGNGLVRDTYSMGVISTNTIAYEAAKQRKAAAQKRLIQERQEKLSFQATQKDVNELKQQMGEIKDLLAQLLQQGREK